MRTLARQIIDAVQNTMLDTLLRQLTPLLWLGLVWSSARLEPVAALWLMPAFVLFVFVWWGLGALANRRPRSRRAGPLEKLHDQPPNGFAAWDELPEGGLKPPAFMRRLVTRLGGRPRSNWGAALGFTVFMGLFVLMWTLMEVSSADWADIHPLLADPGVRDRLFLGGFGVMTVLLVRNWATTQRLRLEPEPAPRPVSRPWDYAMGSILFCGTLAVMAVPLHLPVWWGLAVGAGVSALLFLPPWRARMADAIFGRRDDPARRPAP